MKKTSIVLYFSFLTYLNVFSQNRVDLGKDLIYIIEEKVDPIVADSASQKYFDDILKVFQIEYNKNNDFQFLPVGKKSSRFMNGKNSNVVIDYPSYNLINRDSSIILALSWFDMKKTNDKVIKGFKNYVINENHNEDLFKDINRITRVSSKKIKITERINEPNYQYYNADKIGDFEILSNEPLYYLNYRYLTSYYILKENVGYFRIYKFVKKGHTSTSLDLHIPKLFKFK